MRARWGMGVRGGKERNGQAGVGLGGVRWGKLETKYAFQMNGPTNFVSLSQFFTTL